MNSHCEHRIKNWLRNSERNQSSGSSSKSKRQGKHMAHVLNDDDANSSRTGRTSNTISKAKLKRNRKTSALSGDNDDDDDDASSSSRSSSTSSSRSTQRANNTNKRKRNAATFALNDDDDDDDAGINTRKLKRQRKSSAATLSDGEVILEICVTGNRSHMLKVSHSFGLVSPVLLWFLTIFNTILNFKL